MRAAQDARFYGLTILGLVLFPFVIHPIGGYAGLATQILIVGIASIGFNILLGGITSGFTGETKERARGSRLKSRCVKPIRS